MEPRIQYTKTEDGVNIAFATYGAGEPLVLLMNPAGSHVQLEWEHGPLMKVAITLLAAERLVVRLTNEAWDCQTGMCPTSHSTPAYVTSRR